MDYKETLNLPQTEFPMRGNLPAREPEILARWAEAKLQEKIEQSTRDLPSFILHDGPPYANGHIHMGHALNKVLKDIILKSRRMQGHYVPYVPGWDCHGLPIELKVDQKLGNKKREISKADFRRLCRQYAQEWIDIQRDEFKRLGILGDWENPYLTMSTEYEAATARELARFAEKGGLYKGKKPVHWCSSCVTALAEAEVEYDNHTSPSIFVKFPFADSLPAEAAALAGKPLFFVIWTTTPWTIPANLGVCLNPEYTYVAIEHQGERLVVAEGLREKVCASLGIEDAPVVASFSGAIFENLDCRHPLYDRPSKLILGDHVTLEAGTGCVHTAPGHGQDDYVVGLRYGLEVYNPVDDYGRYVKDLELFGGLNLKEANPAVIEALTERGMLLKASSVEHSYPHCWRCKKPIIFRATDQWFISMESNELREKSLQQIDATKWIPHWGRDRIYNMVENRPDWCVSRQRSWGVPITVFYCLDCGTAIDDAKVMHHVADLFEEGGSDIWFEREPAELVPAGTCCPGCSGTNFRKEMDILDVWFDSGVSHAAVLEQRDNLSSPADLYLEGSDQHRGWFHSSLLASVGTRDRAPYKAVLTHGFVLDHLGRPMSKSVGNVIAPDEVVKKFGADILRLWVAAQDYRDDIKIGQETLQRLSDAYRRIRNTARYILGNLAGFNPATDLVPYSEMLELDRWALSKLEELLKRVEKSYDDYEFHVLYHAVHNFCSIELSSFYLDIIKDRLYTSKSSGVARRSAQTAIYKILDALTRLIAPVLSFTADEIWQELPGEREENVHLARFPRYETSMRDTLLEERFSKLIQIRADLSKALETARTAKLIGSSLDARVTLAATGETAELLKSFGSDLTTLLIVSQVELCDSIADGTAAEVTKGLSIKVEHAGGEKCERCWNYSGDIGSVTEHPALCSRCADAMA